LSGNALRVKRHATATKSSLITAWKTYGGILHRTTELKLNISEAITTAAAASANAI